eukprot:comp24080_c0_seq1/m.43365 comp24080_c0_seq1/g.43365  ORF comp24080_c0_seq1/g.43365 comp24080_c0_seq1/m.43365 type:complete len:1444 (-) comp24080_c0_seq1:309-4640(-)
MSKHGGEDGSKAELVEVDLRQSGDMTDPVQEVVPVPITQPDEQVQKKRKLSLWNRKGEKKRKQKLEADRELVPPIVCPEKTSSIFSFALFNWVSPLIAFGNKKLIDLHELWLLPPEEESAHLCQLFMEAYKANPNKSVPWTLFATVKWTVIRSAFFMLLYTICQLSNPLLLRALVVEVSAQSFDGLYYALLLGLVGLVGAFSNQHHLHLALRSGQRMRALVMAVVYHHTLQLNVAARNGVTHGEVVNYLSNDSQKFYDLMPLLNLLWAAPLQIVVATYFLLNYLGVPALAGIAMLVALIPFSMMMANIQRKLRRKHMPLTDSRVQLLSEMLHGMKVLKYFCWEMSFREKVICIRGKEMKYVWRELTHWAFYIFALIVFPIMSMMVTFAAYTKMHGALNAADTFAALAFFNILKFPLMYVGQVATISVQTWVAVGRLSKYLARQSTELETCDSSDLSGSAKMCETKEVESKETPETIPSDIPQSGNSYEMKEVAPRAIPVAAPVDPNAPPVNVKDATFEWSEDPEGFVMRHVNLSVKAGELIAVVGAVGCGKTMLLQGILKELRRTQGEVDVRGTVAYTAQEPFVINASVRENILFGKPFDETLYRKVLDSCCLWSDLDMWEDGDRTMIGERGVTLSGGQKARVSLARAVYSQADVFLSDDPLSALDAHTGREVFDMVFSKKGIMAHSARILVTHAVQYLARVDRVVVIAEGTIAFNGPYSQLQAEAGSPDVADGQSTTLQRLLASIFRSTQESEKLEVEELDDDVEADKKPKKKLGTKDGKLMTEEERGVGNIGWDVYGAYVKMAGGWPWVVFLFVSFACERATYIGADYWLAWWTSAQFQPPTSGLASHLNLPTASDEHGQLFYVKGYVLWAWANVFFVLCRSLAFTVGGAKAADRLFQRLLLSVLRSPMAFFDTTPLGRIVTRFSYDTETLDYILPTLLSSTIASASWIVSALFVMGTVTPYSLLGVLPVLSLFLYLQSYYRTTCLQLQRLDAVSRSPIQAHFAETLNGTVTIRAFRQSASFVKDNDHLVNSNTCALLAFTVSQRWLGMRLELLGTVITTVVALCAWLARSTLTGGLAGLVVMWSFNMTVSFNFLVTNSTQMEAKMTSAERVLYYANNLTPEAELETKPEKRPPETWPTQGAMTFDDVQLQYRPGLPHALKGLTASIRPKEHIGVVGRTGAGKSTIAVALFRLVETCGGNVSVDGIPLQGLGLSDVRGRAMCIIPQEPVLFSGTLRSNLDPFDQYDDASIWDALRWVDMSSVISNMPDKLHSRVEERGHNFSTGQRQLLCLARALLRRPKILIMDEATASVDAATDHLIQHTVRNAFAQSTIIEIAHRLHSVMDADRVIVMSAGKVAEFDSPYALLQDPQSMFSTLVESTGPQAAAQLREMAIQAQRERENKAKGGRDIEPMKDKLEEAPGTSRALASESGALNVGSDEAF